MHCVEDLVQDAVQLDCVLLRALHCLRDMEGKGFSGISAVPLHRNQRQ
jgi:hypothetical protein